MWLTDGKLSGLSINALATKRCTDTFNRRRRLNRISGIPVLKTTGVTASTTEVRYDVNEEEWRALPNEGLFFLDVRQEVPTASADLPVTLKAEESTPDGTSMLRNALAEDV